MIRKAATLKNLNLDIAAILEECLSKKMKVS
jgi:hypothetical protein